MHNDNRGFLSTIETYVDMFINLVAFLIAYVITILIEGEATLTFESPYTVSIIFVNILLASFVYHVFNMYRKTRYMGKFHSFPEIFRANFIYFGIMLLIAALWNVREGYGHFAIVWLAITAVLSTAFLTFKRHVIKVVIRSRNRKNYNLKKVIIVGDNSKTAADYVKEVQSNPNYGIIVLGHVGDKIDPIVGTEKLGTFKDFAKVLDKYHPTDVVFAIDSYDKWRLIKLVNMCDDRCVKVYFLPVIYGFFKHSRQIENVGSIPVINIHSTPLDNGANAMLKRIVDILGSLFLIFLTAPFMIFAAVGVAISSPGPIFFKQTRVGKLGKKFTMLKFRSMRVNTGSNDTWTTDEDVRKTKFGTFLRRTAIDELPQLFNVLGGSMSLVGPRPELPVFVEHFKEEIPLYMVKHYVKPGITGLAQIKGLRGDTSVEDRIHEDIEYIEHWSLWLDIMILLKTPFKAFNKNEKYVDEKKNAETVSETPQEAASIPASTPAVSFDKEICDEPAKLTGKKILYAASSMAHINSFHLEYIDRLRKAGNVVLVMARGDGADFNIPFQKQFFSSKNTYARRKIKEIVLAENFDLIITHTTLAAFHIRLAVPQRQRPRIVNMVHGYLFSQNSGFIKRSVLLFCEKLVRRKTDAIIVMNKDDMRIAKRNRLSSGKVYFCRGLGVKPKLAERTPKEVREELGSKHNYNLAFAGELSGRKNQKFLISSMPRIKEFIPHAKLWLIGDGDKREELSELAKKLGVENEVLFLGRRENVGDYVNAADIYVSASKSEGLPFNIVEAMMLGKTVLATRRKGQEDIIVSNKSGYLFEIDKSDEFAESVKLIHDGIKKLDENDIKARGHEYSYDEVFEETLQIMMEAANERADFKHSK
ncbi:MAG: undecaprenyl-phosphate glucose phosphotransferase [Clostridia bacterium]|nr:undecaprenyl-phosphate glucose phosphotransferase [Clostridia bacterium]